MQTGQERSTCPSKLPTWDRYCKKQKAKVNGDESIASAKCYNCGRKGYYARDCPEPSKVPFHTKIPNVNVCSYAFVANSLPQWIEHMGTNKYIVQDKAGFMESIPTRWVHELSFWGMEARKMSLK